MPPPDRILSRPIQNHTPPATLQEFAPGGRDLRSDRVLAGGRQRARMPNGLAVGKPPATAPGPAISALAVTDDSSERPGPKSEWGPLDPGPARHCGPRPDSEPELPAPGRLSLRVGGRRTARVW